MIWDSVHNRLLLYAGDAVSPPADVWELSGGDWRQSTNLQMAAIDSAGVFDVARGRALIYGGWRRDTWALVNRGEAEFETLTEGCTRLPQRPVLAAFAGDRPFLGESFEIEVVDMSSSRLAFLLLGSSDRNWFGLPLPFDLVTIGMDRCRLQVRPDVTGPLLVANNRSRAALSVPNDPGLTGTRFYLQVLQDEPLANPFGATLSNAAGGVIGRR